MKTTYLIKTTLFAALTFLVISCQNGTKLTDGNPIDISETSSDSIESIDEIKKTSDFSSVEMLLPVQYRKEGTGYPENVKTKEWFEFYKDEKTGQWKIEKSKPVISYGRDECVGDDVMIIKATKENSIMFISAFEGIMENPATLMEDKAIFPDHNLKFNFRGKDYQLSPIGSYVDNEGHIMTSASAQEMSEDDLGDTRIDDYMLSFTAPEDVSYNIATVPQIIGTIPRVIWAGDMNGDGLPDLVLSLSNFYESVHVFLFLSDENDIQKPLKKAADLDVQNDC